MHRWTYEEIRTTGTRQFVKAILEREKVGKNPVSPLAVKLDEGLTWVDRVVDPVEEEQNGYSIRRQPIGDRLRRIEAGEEPNPLVTELPPPSEVTEKGQTKLLPGEDIKEKIVRPTPLGHRKAVSHTEEEQSRMLSHYLARGTGTKGYGPDGKWLYKEEEIFRMDNTTSGDLNRTIWHYGPKGELFRVPRKKQLRLKGIPTTGAQAPVQEPVAKTGAEDKAFLLAETPTAKLWFEGWKRKRWANIYQKELWEKCEKDVGPVNMTEATKWALGKGISNINSVITYAIKLKKRHGYR